MRKLMRITILEVHNNHLYIAGSIRNYHVGKERFYLLDEKEKQTEIIPVRAEAIDTVSEESHKLQKGYYYELSLPLYKGASFRFFCSQKAEESVLSLRFGKYSRLSSIDGCYFRHNGLLIYSEGDSIKAIADNIITRAQLDRKYKKALSDEASAEILALRHSAIKLKSSGKPIWLVSDRSDSADDNGMALFEYLMRSDETASLRASHDIRFIIGSGSPAYQKMKQLGPVVEASSDMHKALYVASEMVISSAADEWVRNPLGADRKYFRDLIDNRFVFLQHGVIKDDLSGWLYKLYKNFSIFITTAPAEWRSICEGAYGYDESVVKLTGLARYDKLENNPEKKIAILPTWRKYAAPDLIPGSSERPYSSSFKETEYFRFYNSLINDPRLLGVMKEHGYTGTFYLHPNHMNQWADFEGNDIISVWQDLIPFSKIFSENALLITDFSSVAIDFAYLGKPVIYTQFDKEAFETSHSYVPGYYSYDKDGFGPVCYDYESAVEAITASVSQDCPEEEMYLDRVNHFFAFRDKENCRRIIAEILSLN